MDIVTFLRFAEAIRLIYEVDFEPREDAFCECSAEQYRAIEEQGYDRTSRWFVVTRGIFEQTNNPPQELRLVDEAERELLLNAARWIHDVTNASGEEFSSFRERMVFLKKRLPEVLWSSAPTKTGPRLVRNEPENEPRDAD